MTLRNIVIEPDPILRKKSSKLENVDDHTRKLLDDMLQTMYKAPGIGLAAVQIGILKRLIVIDISKKEEEKDFIISFYIRNFGSETVFSYINTWKWPLIPIKKSMFKNINYMSVIRKI